MPKTHGSCIHAGVCKYEDEQRASDCDDYVNNDVEEKAEKWDRVKEIADSRLPCKCPLREKWGTERCPNDFMAFTSHDMCPVCNGSGKIRSAWAREGE